MSDLSTISRAEDLIYLLRSLPVPEYVGVDYIAHKTGRSDSYLRDRPWLLPAFGVSEAPGRVLSWTFATASKWLDVPLSVHQAEWDALPVATKKAITDKRRAG